MFRFLMETETYTNVNNKPMPLCLTTVWHGEREFICLSISKRRRGKTRIRILSIFEQIFRDKKRRRANLSLKIKKPDKKVDQRAKSKSIYQILISSSSEIGQIDTFPSCERDIRESRAAVWGQVLRKDGGKGTRKKSMVGEKREH